MKILYFSCFLRNVTFLILQYIICIQISAKVSPVKYGRETEEQIFNNLQLVLRTLVSRELPFRKSHKDNAKQDVLIRDIEYAHRSPITSAVKANFVHEIYTT